MMTQAALNAKPLKYDASANASINQYVFWIMDFDTISGIAGIEDDLVNFEVLRGSKCLAINADNKKYILESVEESILKGAENAGRIVVTSVPHNETGDLSAYELKIKA